MSALRVLVVDDEAPARTKLRRYIEDYAFATCVGEAANGLDAVTQIEVLSPDVVLLDVQMPGLDGFEVLEALPQESVPYIIFVTAHDEHAVRAFEVRAMDYLLKPIDRERLSEALKRVHAAAEPQDVRGLLSDQREPDVPLERFLVRERGRLILVPTEDVDWIGAAGNYVELHVARTNHLVRGTLSVLEERLPSQRFLRIHRSTIVNLDRIHELQPWSHGDLTVVLKDGTELRMSRRYRDRLEGTFGA